MASSSLTIPASNATLCAAILNDTTVDIFALQQEQGVEDHADMSLLLRSKPQEHDIAMSPKSQPLSRYIGLPSRIKATMISSWELYASSADALAKWNIKVSAGASVNLSITAHFSFWRDSELCVDLDNPLD
jgi:hypothetical protein